MHFFLVANIQQIFPTAKICVDKAIIEHIVVEEHYLCSNSTENYAEYINQWGALLRVWTDAASGLPRRADETGEA